MKHPRLERLGVLPKNIIAPSGSKKPWGMREFAVHTPDGHRMTFGAEARAA